MERGVYCGVEVIWLREEWLLILWGLRGIERFRWSIENILMRLYGELMFYRI